MAGETEKDGTGGIGTGSTENPAKTGDEADIAGWFAVAVTVAGALVIVGSRFGKKQKR